MSVWSKIYERINWKDLPQRLTALAARNLNKMDLAIDTLDDRTIGLNTRLEAVEENPIDVDTELKPDSTNPVQNKIITEALREIMPEVTVTGNPISISDGSNVVPAKLAEVTFLPKQSGSGEPSPDNVRPISGWTEVNLYLDEEQTATPETTYTESLGSTYYGGKITWNADGSCTADIDRGLYTFDGTESWNINASGTHSLGITDMKSGANMDGISSIFPTGDSRGNIRFGTGNPSNPNSRIYLMEATQAYEADTSAKLNTLTNGSTICYPLATPIELTLTPQEIELLKGQNVLWSDSNGNIKLTYSADIKAWVENQLSV